MTFLHTAVYAKVIQRMNKGASSCVFCRRGGCRPYKTSKSRPNPTRFLQHNQNHKTFSRLAFTTDAQLQTSATDTGITATVTNGLNFSSHIVFMELKLNGIYRLPHLAGKTNRKS
jgi:hypothetical protein